MVVLVLADNDADNQADTEVNSYQSVDAYIRKKIVKYSNRVVGILNNTP